jgi:hypothetical protein
MANAWNNVDSLMNRALAFIIFAAGVSLTTSVYAGSLYGSLGSGGGSLYGSLGSGSVDLYGSLGSGSSYSGGSRFRGGRDYKNHRDHFRGHKNYGFDIAGGCIGTPSFIEYVPQPAYYVPEPVYYEPVPAAEAPAPSPVEVSPAPAPVAAPDTVPRGHWEVQKIWVPDNKRNWIEKYYDESRDVLVLSNREEKLGTNGHWAEREIWVEDYQD